MSDRTFKRRLRDLEAAAGSERERECECADRLLVLKKGDQVPQCTCGAHRDDRVIVLDR